MQKINTRVLVSGAEFFDDGFAINSHMDDKNPVDLEKAIAEHAEIISLYKQAGIEVIKIDAPAGCQDGVYTANWGLVRGNVAVLSNLPNKRQAEEDYAEKALKALGLRTTRLPEGVRFSGQGDALPCGKYLFVGTGYRTSLDAHQTLEEELGLQVIGLQAIPQLDANQNPVINPVTGWPDSFFYDLDLALAVISPNLIAWCPEAFLPDSQAKIRAISDLEKIEVSLDEAKNGFACNLVSTGESVIMSSHAPSLKNSLESRGLNVYTPEVTELLKGGGFIRCISLTIDN